MSICLFIHMIMRKFRCLGYLAKGNPWVKHSLRRGKLQHHNFLVTDIMFHYIFAFYMNFSMKGTNFLSNFY